MALRRTIIYLSTFKRLSTCSTFSSSSTPENMLLQTKSSLHTFLPKQISTFPRTAYTRQEDFFLDLQYTPHGKMLVPDVQNVSECVRMLFQACLHTSHIWPYCIFESTQVTKVHAQQSSKQTHAPLPLSLNHPSLHSVAVELSASQKLLELLLPLQLTF